MTQDTASLQGDETALFERYHGRLVRVVSGRVRTSRETVEDACTFAWVQLLRYQPERTRVFAWLVQVAVREGWRLAAGEQRTLAEGEPPDTLVSSEPTLEERVYWLERLEELADLRIDERELLMLKAAGYSYDELSAVTGHTWRAVCRRLKRARRHLQEQGGQE